MNTYNQHLNRYKQITREFSSSKDRIDNTKLNVYETIYMHMTNRNPISLLNQQMIMNDDNEFDDDEDDDASAFSKCKKFIFINKFI